MSNLPFYVTVSLLSKLEDPGFYTDILVNM